MNLHHANRGSGEQSGGLSTVSKNSGRIIAAIVGAIIIKPTRLAALAARAANQRRVAARSRGRVARRCFRRRTTSITSYD